MQRLRVKDIKAETQRPRIRLRDSEVEIQCQTHRQRFRGRDSEVKHKYTYLEQLLKGDTQR